MKTHKELPIIDSLIIKSDVFEDLRGFFITSWEEYNSRISIENFNREFSGKEILSRSLADAGYIVLLAHKSIIRVLVSHLPLKNQIFLP